MCACVIKFVKYTILIIQLVQFADKLGITIYYLIK